MRRDAFSMPLDLGRELIIDNFAGGGGTSTGQDSAFGRPMATSTTKARMGPENLEDDIKAIVERIDRSTHLMLGAMELMIHHRAEIRALTDEMAAMKAQRSPEVIARLEKERGIV